MGYKRDGYAMGARYGVRDAGIGTWLTGDLVARKLLEPLAADGLLAHCTHVSEDLGTPLEIESESALLERSLSWRYQIIQLFSGPDDDDPDFEVQLSLDTNRVQVSVRLGGGVLASAQARLLELAPRWVTAWSGMSPGTVMLMTGGLRPWIDAYPRPRPPRQSSTWSLGAIQQYVGLAWHQTDPADATIVQKLLDAPLPAGATRHQQGDLLLLSFVDDLRDPTRVAAAQASHEAWLSPLVDAAPEQGWNELGDRIVIPDDAAPLPPLTLHEPSSHIGYKALLVEPDGSIDDELWAEMVALIRSGSLPDGTPLAALRLVVPRREDAVAVHDRAIADGFQMVVYPRGQVFWQVNPT